MPGSHDAQPDADHICNQLQSVRALFRLCVTSRTDDARDRVRSEPQHGPACIERVRTQHILDPEQLVVLGGPVGARERAGLDLTAVRGDGQICNRRILGLARPVRHDRRVGCVVRHLDRFQRLRQ